MRVLILLRGAPGCGKSTWVKDNGLEQYTLSSDDFRMMYSSLSMKANGGWEISQKHDAAAWKALFQALEYRMQNGDLTVIDATNSKTKEMKRYKSLCDEYRYRMYCVDFTDVPIETAKAQNRMRPEWKWVPDEAIEKIYARFATQSAPSGIIVIKPSELHKVWLRAFDLSHYKCVHHIGDIHGCYSALRTYLDMTGGIKDDEMYIFCGDYIDRGLENADVIRFLLSVYQKPNVLLLEGNHERWLWKWASDTVCESHEFELLTRTQLEDAGVDKRDVRKLYRKFGQCAYYTYGEKLFFVSHAGVSCIPANPTMISTSQLIRGVGSYNEMEAIADTFLNNSEENVIQIFGHRNIRHAPIQVNDRVYCLEGQVEFGGHLRCVQVRQDGEIVPYEIKNDVYKEGPPLVAAMSEEERDIGRAVMDFRKNKYIREKSFGHISSFNYTKAAFYNGVWDKQTTKARGLYINVPLQKIVARGYDKFFNIDEVPETKITTLERTLQFPVSAYVKENGFLGIVGYDPESEELIVTTKSDMNGDYAAWFRDVLYREYGEDTIMKVREYIRENDVSFVFECIDPEHDPHIIHYERAQAVLLDIVKNDLCFVRLAFEDMRHVAFTLGLACKERAKSFGTWQEFYDWYCEVTDIDYEYKPQRPYIEGFVLEDAKGYMTKLKLAYYKFWKYMRGVAYETLKNGYIRKTGSLDTALANEFYGFCREQYRRLQEGENVPKDICSLRERFYADCASKNTK